MRADRLPVLWGAACAPSETEQHLLRMAQEAPTNVLSHGQAQHIQIRLHYMPTQVQLRVEDDGQGFDLDTVPAGYGVRGMYARAEAIGGRLRLSSQPGQGTQLCLVMADGAFVTALPSALQVVEPGKPSLSQSGLHEGQSRRFEQVREESLRFIEQTRVQIAACRRTRLEIEQQRGS